MFRPTDLYFAPSPPIPPAADILKIIKISINFSNYRKTFKHRSKIEDVTPTTDLEGTLEEGGAEPRGGAYIYLIAPQSPNKVPPPLVVPPGTPPRPSAPDPPYLYCPSVW